MSISNKKTGKATNALDVYRNEAFDIGFKEYFDNESHNKISQVLNSKDRNLKLSTITYRQLNSWEDQGLLNADREGREWRRFSVIDALWIKIIQELRAFGLSWAMIKTAKECLSFQAGFYGVPMPMLEFYTAFAVGSKMPVLLLVFKDGLAVPCSFSQYKVAKEVLGVENHIQISLNELLQGMFPDMDLKPKKGDTMDLNLEEMQLLAFIRLKKFEKVEVKYKDGKMDVIEGLEKIDIRKRLDEILREQKFATIELIEEDGEITRFVRKIKKKIN